MELGRFGEWSGFEENRNRCELPADSYELTFWKIPPPPRISSGEAVRIARRGHTDLPKTVAP
jgi:hypothetical protein